MQIQEKLEEERHQKELEELDRIQKEIREILEASRNRTPPTPKKKRGRKPKQEAAIPDAENDKKTTLQKKEYSDTIKKETFEIEIPLKLPSLNQYINASRAGEAGRYIANNMKQNYTKEIKQYIKELPKLNKVAIEFLWTERRQQKRPRQYKQLRKKIYT